MDDLPTRLPIDASSDFFYTKKTTISQSFEVHTREWRMFYFYVFAVSVMVDPFYLYVSGIDANKNCIHHNETLKESATVIRSVCDAIYVFLTAARFLKSIRSSTISADDNPRRRAYALYSRLICVLATLPLPQVAVMIIAPQMKGSKGRSTKDMQKVAVFSQFIPRFLMVNNLHKDVDNESSMRNTKSKTVVWTNLFLYVYLGHVIGASWYFFSMERVLHSCRDQEPEKRVPFCDEITDLNPIKSSFPYQSCRVNSPMEFGLYSDAINSGILQSEYVIDKVLYCFWWALQNLSSLGKNLKPARQKGEICFAIGIFVCGLMLVTLVIGILQTRLLSATTRSEEIRNKWQNVEHWMARNELPENLRKLIREHESHKLRETRGVGVADFLDTLPKDLGRATKRHLGLKALEFVPIFEKLERPVLDAICDRLRPVLYTRQRYIITEGSLVDEMVFITRGELKSETATCRATGSYGILKAGNFCGEELLPWSMGYKSSSLPIATRTVQTLTNVEAFSLQAEDLKFVFTQFRVFQGSQFWKQNYRFYSVEWRAWAAYYIQNAWRRHARWKLRRHRGG